MATFSGKAAQWALSELLFSLNTAYLSENCINNIYNGYIVSLLSDPSPVVSSGYIRPGGSRNYQIEEEEQDDLVSIESTERDEDNDVVLSPSLTSNEG